MKQHKRLLTHLLGERSDAPELFLVDWYGPAERPRAGSHELPDLPPPLRRLYELTERWPQAIVQNALLSPPQTVDERVVFYVENQGVYERATVPGPDAASVWGRFTDSRVWIEEEPSLSAFVLQLLVFEAVMGAEYGASVAWLPSERLADVVAPLHRLPRGSWRWPDYPTSFYAGNDVLAVAAPNRTPSDPGDDFSVFIAGRNSDAVAYLDDLVDDAWEHFSRRDSA